MLKKFFASVWGFATITVVYYALEILVMMSLHSMNGNDIFTYIAGIGIVVIYGPALYIGWRKTNESIDGMRSEGGGCFMPILWWVFLIIIKLVIALVIGLFVAPPMIGRKIQELAQK